MALPVHCNTSHCKIQYSVNMQSVLEKTELSISLRAISDWREYSVHQCEIALTVGLRHCNKTNISLYTAYKN